MRQRTEEEKRLRRESDKKATEAYKSFYANNQKLLIICKACKQEKELKNFVANAQFRNLCKKCHRKQITIWRQKHPELVLKTRKKQYKKSSNYVYNKKQGIPCSTCKKIYPPCAMDFHHINIESKFNQISKLYGKIKLNDEINKCILLCANCHRNLTYEERHKINILKNRYIQPEITETPTSPGDPTQICLKCKFEKHQNNFTLLKTGKRHSYCKKCLRKLNKIYNTGRKTSNRPGKWLLKDLKDNKPCTDCRKTYRYWIMDFDHIKGEKTANMNVLQNGNMHTILNEISKCDLVCANCHRIRTYNRSHHSSTDSDFGVNS
jgi:hypothetical protein